LGCSYKTLYRQGRKSRSLKSDAFYHNFLKHAKSSSGLSGIGKQGKMRRSEKEIKDPGEIEAILQAAQVCRIAMAEGDVPYIVPVNFAVSAGCLYFHCATSGRKIDMLRKNHTVCFEVDMPGDLVRNESACSWGMKYRSVIGFGQADFIEHAAEKKQALDILMKKYAGNDGFSYDDDQLDKVCVIGVRIDTISGKRSD